MLATTIGGGFGQQQQLPYRQSMASSVKTVQESVMKYINDMVASQNPVYSAAVKTLNSVSDGNQRVNDAIIGVVNYVDYLINVEKLDGASALERAKIQCIDGFMANILLRSPMANSIDNSVRHQLNQAEQMLGQAIQAVQQHIAPAIMQERQGGFNNTGAVFGNAQVRRTDVGGFGGNQGGGPNLLGGQSNQGSIFSSNQAAPDSNGGGGLNLGIDQVAITPKPDPLSVPMEYKAPTAQTQTSNQNNLVTYMNYEQHKTHGLLKAVLPSDAKRSLMPVVTVDNNFAAMAALSQYTKLGNEVIRSDVTTNLGAGYSLEQIIATYGQKDYSTMVVVESSRALQLERRELDRLTFSGTLIQLFPELDEEGKLKEILARYNQGLMTHGRLTSLVSEMETVLQPETIACIAKKLADYSSNYWRFNMQETAGEFTNYFEGHDGATEYLRRAPNKGMAAEAWAAFPGKVVSELFLEVPVSDGEGNEQPALGFQVGYVRVPYFAVELPIGTEGSDDGDFGMVLRNATPGLYHLCQTLYEGFPGVAHRCIMTNEGRLLEVIKPLIGETDRFYIREMTNGLLP